MPECLAYFIPKHSYIYANIFLPTYLFYANTLTYLYQGIEHIAIHLIEV